MSKRYLRAVASRSRLSKQYAEELAGAVLSLPIVLLALGIQEGGPKTYTAATELAERILRAVDAAPVRAARAGA